MIHVFLSKSNFISQTKEPLLSVVLFTGRNTSASFVGINVKVRLKVGDMFQKQRSKPAKLILITEKSSKSEKKKIYQISTR